MLPQKPFYLIGHGESEANAAKISAGGGFDSPLTEKGRRQPQELAPYLKQLEIKPGIIYHSPMIRAKDTAKYLNHHLELKMIEHHDLREHEFGELGGKPQEECRPYFENKEGFPGGENYHEFATRIQTTITEIVHKVDGIPMIVAHSGLFLAIADLYEYDVHMSSRNCYLHYFEPEPAFSNMPFRIWNFDIEGECLKKNASPFCASHNMPDVA